MLTKSAAVAVKTIEEDAAGDGVFEAIVSVFGNVDSYGDRVVKGAFADSLEEWSAKGDPIPVYWAHRMDDPDYNIGHVLHAEERDEGLYVKAQLDLESPKALQVHRLLKARRVSQFSFQYDVLDAEQVKDADFGEVLELRKLRLYEVGPCPIGVNQATDLITVKATGAHALRLAEGIKAGRVLSAKNEDELRSAHEAIGRVLAALQPDDDAKSARVSLSSNSILTHLAVIEADHEMLTEGARS